MPGRHLVVGLLAFGRSFLVAHKFLSPLARCRLSYTSCVRTTRLVPSTPADGPWVMLAGMSSGGPDERPISEADTAGLPASIAADLLEASTCCTCGAYRAAGLLARRAVEQVAVLRGVPLEMRTLDQKLGWLLAAGHLTRDVLPDARAVRDLGNAAAHGAEAVTEEEAGAGVRAGLAVALAVSRREGNDADGPRGGSS